MAGFLHIAAWVGTMLAPWALMGWYAHRTSKRGGIGG